MTDKTELEVTSLRDLIAEVAADLSADNPYWTAGCLADALIAKGVGLTTRTPDPTPVAWMPIESAPKDEPILAAIKVQNNKTGASWWERHIIVIDSETGKISDMDYHHGWEADDYEGWQPLPSAPGDAPVPPAVPDDGLVEALEWALAELRGKTRYDNPEQALNCFAKADEALAAYRGES